MKVVIPVGSLHVGGGCRVLAQVANALVKRGHETELVIPENMPIDYPLICKVTKIKHLDAKYIPYGDIVLPNFYTTFYPSYHAWPNQCVRFSLGFEPLWVPEKVVAFRTYAEDVPIISISSWLDEQIYQSTGKRSKVINLGIDPKIFHPNPKFKRKSDVKHRTAHILYIARHPQAYQLKGFSDFAKAMSIFRQKYRKPYIVDLICPEGKVLLPGIPHRIYQPQNDQEVARLYRNADLFVSTSWFEGFALPPLEAQACRTPVVTTDSGGIRDFVKHRHSGFIVKTKNPYSIARGMLKVLEDRNLARELKRNGFYMAQKLTVENFENNMVSELERIYSLRS